MLKGAQRGQVGKMGVAHLFHLGQPALPNRLKSGCAGSQEPEKKIQQPLCLKKLRNFLVSLTMYNLDFRLATQGLISTRELEGILLEGDNLVGVTVDVENGNIGVGQRR
jgi:hypothetical protein